MEKKIPRLSNISILLVEQHLHEKVFTNLWHSGTEHSRTKVNNSPLEMKRSSENYTLPIKCYDH